MIFGTVLIMISIIIMVMVISNLCELAWMAYIITLIPCISLIYGFCKINNKECKQCRGIVKMLFSGKDDLYEIMYKEYSDYTLEALRKMLIMVKCDIECENLACVSISIMSMITSAYSYFYSFSGHQRNIDGTFSSCAFPTVLMFIITFLFLFYKNKFFNTLKMNIIEGLLQKNKSIVNGHERTRLCNIKILRHNNLCKTLI